MGRTQSFDTTEVVRRSRAVFWDRGFEAASLPELEAATGLNRSSLYHAFGSKRGLFDAAVQSYLDDVIRPLLRPLVDPDADPGAVAVYFRRLGRALDDPDSIAHGSGCLLVNAATAPIGRDAEVRGVVAGYRRELAAALRSGVAARWPDRPEEELTRTAGLLAALNANALLMARIDPEAAQAAIGLALDLLAQDGGGEPHGSAA
ncbi:TetR/AcrR family transcriptional regulator [Zafaria sp. Z1313]|uniref:TetR/AcrR family transcriptional regulator n=1 Tax=unclassified Zafaria TaxID=2828765 RepID=UPI002E75DDF0|nr:helix-turn-helix domain-containing protein [Zafaria sp. J156]MEE1622417.1 helix-turn-helix domain-containing protein [Zafaria sp. J156]